ncbi:protein translocase subunit SecF [Flagellatimonas centrodinii]|uniref:protein translocase subunit SecF n=1 Tax=Flagellatimonas centrodinii TaxID=2806210 RepID=UPI001FEDFB8B|nr:protein translocase subunit SecF [Flagellatimonas centrodinii]ULQ46876.1 protein translocase subunit SecF [Flagellatimonas centrodinii]
MRLLSRVPNINFMAIRRPMLAFAVVTTLVSLALVGLRGLNFGLDFSGGVLVEVVYAESVALDPVRARLDDAGLTGATVQYFGSSTDVMIRLGPDAAEGAGQISTRILEALSADGPALEVRRVEFVGPQVGDELATDGALAALFAIIGILIYVAFRFEWKFAVGSIVATVHDAFLVLGWFALLGIEFDLTVLAAILALIGYSLNDTIVVYDRIRENFIDQRRASTVDVVNLSVNQTLARTIVTGGTTLFVLTALFFLGGSAVHGFSIALIVGILVGTYSSVFIASSMVLVLGVTREDLLPPQDEEIDETP